MSVRVIGNGVYKHILTILLSLCRSKNRARWQCGSMKISTTLSPMWIRHRRSCWSIWIPFHQTDGWSWRYLQFSWSLWSSSLVLHDTATKTYFIQLDRIHNCLVRLLHRRNSRPAISCSTPMLSLWGQFGGSRAGDQQSTCWACGSGGGGGGRLQKCFRLLDSNDWHRYCMQFLILI